MRSFRATVATLLGAGALLGLLAGPAAAAALRSERYAPIDAVYTALVVLDRPNPSSSALAAAERACKRLDADDALLGPMRRSCAATVRAFRDTRRLETCRSIGACVPLIFRLRTTIGAVMRQARAANRAIDATVADAACRRALRSTAKELRDAERVHSALGQLARALKAGSEAGAQQAAKRLKSIRPASTAAQKRTRFRRACG